MGVAWLRPGYGSGRTRRLAASSVRPGSAPWRWPGRQGILRRTALRHVPDLHQCPACRTADTQLAWPTRPGANRLRWRVEPVHDRFTPCPCRPTRTRQVARAEPSPRLGPGAAAPKGRLPATRRATGGVSRFRAGRSGRRHGGVPGRVAPVGGGRFPEPGMVGVGDLHPGVLGPMTSASAGRRRRRAAGHVNDGRRRARNRRVEIRPAEQSRMPVPAAWRRSCPARSSGSGCRRDHRTRHSRRESRGETFVAHPSTFRVVGPHRLGQWLGVPSMAAISRTGSCREGLSPSNQAEALAAC